MKPLKRGRPPRPGGRHIVWLSSSTFKLWNDRKQASEFANNSNSEFAEALLHGFMLSFMDESRSSQRKRARSQDSSAIYSPIPCKRPLFASTPRGTACSTVVTRSKGKESASERSFEVDITGSTTRHSNSPGTSSGNSLAQHTTSLERAVSLNPSFGSLKGNPMQAMEDPEAESICSSVEGSCDSVACDMSSECDTEDELREEELLLELPSEILSENDSTVDHSATLSAVFSYYSDSEPEDSETEVESMLPSTIDVGEDLRDVPVQPCTANECTEANSVPQQSGPSLNDAQQNLDATDVMQKKVEHVLEEMCGIDSDFVSHYNRERVITDVEEIVKLFESNCQQQGCSGHCSVVNSKTEGGVMIITWKCTKGHCGVWESSRVLDVNRGQKIYATTVLLAALVIVTGNNFEKLHMQMKFLNVGFVSESTFSRIQSTCVTPVVKELWKDMKEKVWEVLKDNELALAGDGRNDSPGHSAKYCVYTLMEHYLHIIIDLEVVDKRETGGSSVTMEKLALKRLIERAMKDLNIVDLVTDASSMIIALVRTLKEQNTSHLEGLFHSLDIWHKSCKLTAKLSAASKVRGCEAVGEWIEPIRNHFWHCAEQCDGDEQTLRDMWLGVIHHVCGEHEWADGECAHGPLVSTENGKAFLEMDSKPHKAVRDIVADRTWLKTLAFYVKFRHTSKLENFNSMMLKYASKRIAFSYDVFITRILLAALDHNFHLFRDDSKDSTGQVRYKKQYSKRSRNWKAEPLKEPKCYPHWPLLAAKILERRAKDKQSIVRPATLPASHPKQLAPTIAMKEAPSTKDLVEARLSRFTKKSVSK